MESSRFNSAAHAGDELRGEKKTKKRKLRDANLPEKKDLSNGFVTQ